MKVILTRDVPKLGKDGEIVLVADGYARNYLFPRQLALVAKGAAMKEHENRVAREANKSANLLSAAQASAEKLRDQHFQITAKASARSTRLFGSVTEADLAEQIQKQTGVEVDKRKISLIDPIKVTGTYPLTVKLHPEVIVSITLEVVTQEQLDERERLRAAAEAKAAREAAAQAPAAQMPAAQTTPADTQSEVEAEAEADRTAVEAASAANAETTLHPQDEPDETTV